MTTKQGLQANTDSHAPHAAHSRDSNPPLLSGTTAIETRRKNHGCVFLGVVGFCVVLLKGNQKENRHIWEGTLKKKKGPGNSPEDSHRDSDGEAALHVAQHLQRHLGETGPLGTWVLPASRVRATQCVHGFPSDLKPQLASQRMHLAIKIPVSPQ